MCIGNHGMGCESQWHRDIVNDKDGGTDVFRKLW